MEKQTTKGRERITALFDAGTFVEMGAFVRRDEDYDAVLCGYGAIDGKPAYAFVQDSDRNKGAFDAKGAAKIARLYEQAVRCGAPVIGVFDSAGAVVYDGAAALGAYGRLMKCVEGASGIIPQIAYVTGVCSGMAATAAALFDLTVTVKDQSELFVTPPSVTGEDNGKTAYAEANGLSAINADTEADATAAVRALIGLLPRNNQDIADVEPTDDINRAVAIDGLTGLSLVEALADNGIAVALWSGYAGEVQTALARIGGSTVALMAGDNRINDGKLTAKGAAKAAHLIALSDAFSIPVFTLVDAAGTDPVADAAQSGAFAGLAAAYLSATCPKITAVVGKAYGAAFTLLGSRSVGADLALALPDAVISVMDPTAAVAFVWNDRITQEKSRAEVEAEWIRTNATPERAAADGEIDDVVPAAELRQRLCAAVYMLAEAADATPARKHGVPTL